MFYNENGFCVCTISELEDVLKQIYDLLVDWSEHDKLYRCDKMKVKFSMFLLCVQFS